MQAKNLPVALASGLTLSRLTFDLFWLIVLIGILPAVASDTFSFMRPFTQGLLRDDILRTPNLLAYLAPILFAIGIVGSPYHLRRRKLMPLLALAPYLVLTVAYYVNIAVSASALVSPIFETLAIVSLILFFAYSSIASISFVLFVVGLVAAYF